MWLSMDKNKEAVAIFDKLAQLYSEKYMDVNRYHKGLDFIIDHFKTLNGNILELACGPGNVTKYLSLLHASNPYLATDLSPKMIELTAHNNPKVITQLLDCRNINELNQTFEAIIAAFVLPYLDQNETKQLIENALSNLNPNGILYLSTMLDDYSKSGYQQGSTGDRIFMYFYELSWLEETINSLGGAIVYQNTISNGASIGPIDAVLIIQKMN